MAEVQRRHRVTYSQLEILWEFLNSNRDVAVGFNKSAQARETSRRMWEEVAQTLNSFGDGAIKDGKGWSAYWIDYKGKLKKRCATIRSAQSRTDGEPSNVPQLSTLEKKFLNIVGEDFGLGLPGIRVNPFEDSNIHVASTSDMSQIPLQEVQQSLEQEVVLNTIEIIEGVNLRSSLVQEQQQLETESEPPVLIDVHAPEPCISHTAPTSTPEAHPTQAVSVAPTGGEQQQRRRRNRRVRITQEEARRALVETSQLRAETEARNSRNITEFVQVLHRIQDVLERIERRLPSDISMGD
ncbi:unnamed protein product [Parnassius mnemosyne]